MAAVGETVAGANSVDSILQQVREAAAKFVLFLPHALDRMNEPDEMISPDEIRAVVFGGILVEDYLEDVRGHSCLILGVGDGGRPIHVVCAPKPDYLAIITAYLPDPVRWEADWRTRKGR